nr:hypothetical protein [uncultured Blautia sp.]
MKKKQLFAVLLAGSMTVGMAPAAAFAAEDTGAVTEAEASTADENTETPDDGAAVDDQSQSEADAQAEAEAQAAAQAQAEAEAQAAAQAQAEAEAQAAAQAQAEAEAQAQAEEAQQEQTETVTGTTVTDEAGLAAAIAAAPVIDINNVNKDNLTTIVISGTVQITTPVTIPKDKGILIVGKDDTSMIQRAASFTGNLFDVSGALYMLDNSDSTLVVDGGSVNGVPAAGSLIHVANGAKFSMSTGLTLTNNKVVADATAADTTAAAIFNEGGIVHISGGTIENNSSDRGAVYSTGKVFIEKIDKMAEPIISKNTKADGTTPANIILAGEGQLAVNGAITNPQIGFSVENAEERLRNSSAVIVKGDDCSDSDYLQALSVLAGKYEDVNYKVNPENGQLVSNKPVVTVTAKSEKANTVTASIKSDKAGTYYYKCVAKNTEAPTIGDAIKGEKVEAEKAVSLNLTDVKDTSIDLYVWVIADDGSVGEAEKQTIDVTQQKPDAPEPAATAPTITKASFKKWNSISEAVVTITSDKEGQYYYKLVKHGTKVSKSDIDTSKAGKKIAAKTETQIKLSKLNAKTSYDVYVVVKNSAGVSNMKQIALDQSKRPTPTPTPSNQTKASLRWTGYSWRDHSSATVTCVIGADGICNYTWKVKGSSENGGSGKVNIKADKAFNIELNNLPDKEIEVYITAKDSKGKAMLLQPTINGQVKTKDTFKISLPEKSRPKVADPTPTDTPNAYIPDVKESVVQGLDEAIQFYPNQFYEFTVIGAGTTNQDPNEGDVKWVPVYWSTAANPTRSQMHTAWKIGSGKGINKDATYNLYVFFQKYIYTGGQWQETDTIESAVYQFRSAKLTPTGTPGADGTYGTGGQTGSDPDATITGEASATSSNGGNGTRSKNAVSTADNSPIGTMSALAVASLLAGGYVIVRRRKKDI